MAGIAQNINTGAMSFLRAEYSVLIFFVIAVAALLGWAGSTQPDSSSPLIALSFVLGAFCSGLAGFIGMRVATKANVRTTNAARTGLGQALEVAFAGGSVMGMGVVGLGVLGLSVLFIIYSSQFGLADASQVTRVITVLTGFSFGASSIALFRPRRRRHLYQGGRRWRRPGRQGRRRGFRRTTRSTRRPSRITLATMSATSREWAPTCLNPMSVRSLARWCSVPRSIR